MSYYDDEPFNALLGKTLTAIERVGNDSITFRAGEEAWEMMHHQDCCENVQIEDVAGSLDGLVNDGPILLAEEVTNAEGPPPEHPDSYTWTFYKLRTLNGDVTIRWLGESNGYYSETVSFERRP